MNFRDLLGIALGAVIGVFLFGQDAFATVNAPAHYPSPLTVNPSRTFYVSPNGSDVGGCGGGPIGAGSNCATPWGANNNIALTGGDTVMVQGSAPTETTLGSSGWINYNMGGGVTFTDSGTANTPTGYINYICTVNHGCKWTCNNAASDGFACLNLTGNFIAFDGMEIDGVNIQGYNGYNNNNTNTYNAPGQLFRSSGHHHMHLNGIYHGSGGGFGSSVGTDYEYVFATELYDFAGVNSCHTSAYGPAAINVIGGYVASGTWDNLPNHYQLIGNVIHDSGETTAEPAVSCAGQPTYHTDGNCISIDHWSQNGYPYGALIAYNLLYNCGGRGIEVNSPTNVTMINNTVWNDCIDATFNTGTQGGCGMAEVGSSNLSGTTATWKNNIFFRTASASGDASGSYQTGGFSMRLDGGTDAGITNNVTFDQKAGGASVASFSAADNAGNVSRIIANNTTGTDPRLTNPPHQTLSDFQPVGGDTIVIGKGASTSSITPVIAFVTPDGNQPSNPPTIGAFVQGSTPPPALGPPVSINAGGPAVGSFIADAGSTGGLTIANNPSGAVDTSLVANPAPTLVYRSERYGNFSYQVNNAVPGKTYVVNVHETEDVDNGANIRVMDISINGTIVFPSFDIFAATGALHKAIVKTANAVADTNGNITIAFAPHAGSTDTSAKVDGVEVLNPIPAPPLPGNFSYQTGRWYTLDLHIPSSVAPVAHAANTIRCAPAGMRNTATINNVSARIYNADASGHLAFGIYGNGPDNRPANLVTTSATMATTPSGAEPIAALGANVQGGPSGTGVTDKFWVCSNTDSATASFASVSPSGGLTSTLLGSTTPANILQTSGTSAVISHLSCAGAACNGGTSTFASGFPANLAGSTWTEQTTVDMPMIAVQFISVP